MTAHASYEHDIFLSHNHADAEWVAMLAARLEKEDWRGRKLRVFFSPWDIRPGQSIPKRIEEGLSRSRKVGLIMSPGAMDSAWVELERMVTTHIAVSERDDRLIPLYRRTCDEIPALLRPLLDIDFRDDSKFDESYQKLLAVIKDEPLPRGSRPSPDDPAPAPPDIPRPPVVGFVARRDRDGRDIVGRLREELAPRKDQLVVLWGAGGVGKTTLAAEAARSLAADFAGRVVWVSADARTDLPFTTLLDEIARQLGDEDLRRLAPEQKAEAVSRLIASAPTLVVLDNFETISPAEEELCKEFLSQRARCSVLITSRQRIEHLRSVPIDAMSPEEADVFLRHLIDQSPDRDIYTEAVRTRIIETAEANPLIVEWIVGQIDLANDPEEVLSELAQGEGDAAHRVFDRSFNLPQLNNGGRAVLLALSLFVPSASRSALAAVANLDLSKGRNKERFKKAYETLASLWLIGKADTGQRLAVAGLTRELTKARLSHDPRAKTLRPRFVARFLRYAEANSEVNAEQLNAMEIEKDNILNAVNTAFEMRDWRSAIRICSAIAEYLRTRGYWDDAIRYNKRGLEAAHTIKSAWHIGAFTNSLGITLSERGDYFDARKYYERSIEIARQIDEKSGLAATLHALSVLVNNQGECDEARRLSIESLEINKKLGYQPGIATSLYSLGNLAQEQGKPDEARHLYIESLEIMTRIGDQQRIAVLLLSLGSLVQDQGEHNEARRLYLESLEIGKRLGYQSGIAASLHGLGMLAQDQGDLEEAGRLYSESLEIKKRLGDMSGIAASIHQLGTVSFANGRLEEAENLYDQCLALLRNLGHKRYTAECLESIGNLRVAQKSYEVALRLFDEALQLAEAVQDRFRIASVKRSLGLLAEKEGDVPRAAELLSEVLGVFKELRPLKAEETQRELERLSG